MKVIYRITYPNGKVYVGMDLTNTLTYFGSPSSPLVAADFTVEQKRSFTITKDILWESETATDSEVREKEIQLILLHGANDPSKGYNQTPRFRSPKDPM